MVNAVPVAEIVLLDELEVQLQKQIAEHIMVYLKNKGRRTDLALDEFKEVFTTELECEVDGMISDHYGFLHIHVDYFANELYDLYTKYVGK